jgi:VanZ family protein
MNGAASVRPEHTGGHAVQHRILNLGSNNRLAAAYLFFGLMVGFGAIPGEAQSLSSVFGDKLLHFCAYSLLSALIFSGSNGDAWQRASRTLLLVAMLGAADELIQGTMTYRNADVQDWAWDMLAACWSVASMLALDSVGVRFDEQTGDPGSR